MATPEKTGTSSPSTSSSFLPLSRRRRQGSVISMASNVDKEIRNNTLDSIHRAASCTDSLTTFNEFAAPPPSTGTREGLGITGDIQGSLSGLYSKLKATVGGSKDTRIDRNTNADGADDASSIRSERTAGSTTTPSSKYGPRTKRNPSPAVSSLSVNTVPPNTPTIQSDPAAGALKGDNSKEFTHVKSSSNASNNIPLNEKALTTKAVANLRSFTNHAVGASGPTVAVTTERGVPDRKSVSIASTNVTNAIDSQPRGAIKTLKVTDQKVSQSKPTDGSPRNPELPAKLAMTPGLQHERDLETPKASSQRSSGLGNTTLQPVIPPEKDRSLLRPSNILQTDATPGQESRKNGGQPRSPLRGLVRGHSAASTAVSTASSIKQMEEAEEALNAVGGLPSRLRSSFGNGANIQPQNTAWNTIRNGILSREFWMDDENAKDCFSCGAPFTAWRRKHHCRTCGSIFDAKCMMSVKGAHFGQSGTIRVCKRCEHIINGDDDSSEFSDDASISSGLRPRHGSSGAHDISPARSFASLRVNPDARGDQTPTLAISIRRGLDDSKRRSTILENDIEPRLQRPGSSRSLKASLLTRSHNSGHKRHHSRSLLQRGPRIEIDEPAPFHTQSSESPKPPYRLPAFHSDNVIDPDLAAYLSDEGSSEDEQLSLANALSSGIGSRSMDQDKSGFTGLTASSRRRSRLLDKSVSGFTSNSRDADNISLSSARLGRSRSLKHRNHSISSNSHLRSSPYVQRFSMAPLQPSALHHYDFLSSAGVDRFDSPFSIEATEVPATKDAVTAPAALNETSVEHLKRLLRQLLTRFEVGSISSWEKALVPIILQASNDIVPDVHSGEVFDIRHYIKLKKIPGGRPGDSTLVSGLVFTKNLALKSMPRSITYPNILILTFPLEYARHQRHFMSLEPVIRQEREYLQNLVHRIAALRPHLLLVHRNIAGLALQFLEEAKITTAYNVKLSVLEAVSRFAQTRIITSIDKLAIKPAQAGRCAAFYLKTYKYKERKKTYMFLSGCPKHLGCTIVLRGGDEDTLSKIKRITEFMAYVAYNLKLETSFIQDEVAQIPPYEESGTIMPDKEAFKQIHNNKVPETSKLLNMGQAEPQTTEEGTKLKQESSAQNGLEGRARNEKSTDSDEIRLPDDTPTPTFYSNMIEQQQDRIISCSPFVRFIQPYLVVRAREQERRIVYLKHLREQDSNKDTNSLPDVQEKFMLVTPDMIHEATEHAPKKLREVIRAVQDAEYDKAVHSYKTQKKQWEAYVAGSGDMFDPFQHQTIAISYSIICPEENGPCFGPEVLDIGFYNEHETAESLDPDVPLGQYIEDLCISAEEPCLSHMCHRQNKEHQRRYVHGDAELCITVKPEPARRRGLEGVIFMWSICSRCNQETDVTPMSENTWRYSFGKYLELSFLSHGLRPRASICSHDLHRDHRRYFGFQKQTVCVRYENVALLEVAVPRTRITWKVTNDLKFKNDAFLRVEDRINRFMNSVKTRLKGIKLDSVVPEKAEECKEEVNRLTKLSQEHHFFLINKLQEKYMGSDYYEIVPFNRAIRALQEKVVEWDSIFAEFDRSFFPSDKDIRRLATLQLRKIFLDREDSMTSLSSTDDKSSASMTSSIMTEQSSPEETPVLIPQTREMSLEKAQHMLTTVVENNLGNQASEHTEFGTPRTAFRIEEPGDDKLESGSPKVKDVQHLDLAVPEDVLVKKVSEQPESQVLAGNIEMSPISHSVSNASSETSPIQDRKVESPDNIHTPPQSAQGSQEYKDQPADISEQLSSTPRASDFARRKSVQRSSIPLYRAQSQPAHMRREKSGVNSGHTSGLPNLGSTMTHASDASRHHERKPSDRFGLGPVKSGINTHSMIPRSIASRKKESKVSTLAKHFEELSREFERERLRDRKQRASKARQVRAYPVAASKPIIEEYRNFHEAVAERDPSDEQALGSMQSEESVNDQEFSEEKAHDNEHVPTETHGEGETTADETAAETTENDEPMTAESRAESESEDEQKHLDEKGVVSDEKNISGTHAVLTSGEAPIDLKIDLPKHEKSSLMKMLTNFWAERSASGWQPLEYPLNPTDHIFADSDIIVREDEPTSLIAFALDAADYKAKLAKVQEKSANSELQDKEYVEDLFLTSEDQARIERSLLQSTGTHLKYQFQEGSAKMLCKIFYAEQFEAVRRKCGIDHRFVESLSRCVKFDSRGGKTKAQFLKTLDDRILLKTLSQIETQAFLRFAPSYFVLMGEALFHDLPSAIVKMVGFYQIIVKNPVTGVEFNWFVLAMENLFYDRHPDIEKFDLKGSMRNRRIQSTGDQNEVLLDENMVEYIFSKPLFAREHSKRLLRASVYNDTLFLQRQNVMDYSLLLGIDKQKMELVVGIIDCIRTYTWDKKLENLWKGRDKNRPTITSPKVYKARFREAMGSYVLMAPTCWHQPRAPRLVERFEDPAATEVQEEGSRESETN